MTEPRGHDPDYVPQNGDVSVARYTTIYTFDYEEACDIVELAPLVGRNVDIITETPTPTAAPNNLVASGRMR